MPAEPSPLQATTLLPFLRECGYAEANVEKDLRLKDGSSVPLVCFSQRPLDSRSACIVALNAANSASDVVSACRHIGAPVALVCWPDRLQWWKLRQDSVSAFGPFIPQGSIPNFFKTHQQDFSPQTIYRAKTLGRVDVSHQRDFVDLGLMPSVESDAGKMVERLLLDQVATLRTELKWPKDISETQCMWMMKSIFWLLGAKMLHDKKVDNFIRMDFGNVENVFDRVGRHYGLSPEAVLTTDAHIKALQKAADAIARVDLSLTTTEALAYVYENTLITKALRKDLGTHSTPSYLIDYILGRLAPWIEQIPEDQRHVFEPACGHSGFLVSAVRLLTSLLPGTKASPQERRAYLRDHIRGCDVDEFALEIARLSLTLTDIPNPNGWKLTRADAFASDILEKTAAQSMILLSNPPFEAIKPEKRAEYTIMFRSPQFVSRATEILHRSISALPEGGVFGLVVPQTLLHGKNATSFRKLLVDQTELKEICLFPDRVFNFGKPETAIIIGRKTTGPASPLHKVCYRRVRAGQMEGFKVSYAVTGEVAVPQSRFQKTEKNDLRVPDLENIWAECAHLSKLGEFVHIGQGFSFIGEDQPNFPKGAQRTSSVPKPGFEEGFENLGKEVMTHRLPPMVYMNMDERIIGRMRSGQGNGKPQVICSYAPVRGGSWCVAAMIDPRGIHVSSRFNIMRRGAGFVNEEFLWALINTSLANAYAYTHSSKRDILTVMWRRFPVPVITSSDAIKIKNLVQDYFAAVHSYEKGHNFEARFTLTNDVERADAKETLRVLHWRIDAEVLKLYHLPVELERQLLDYFAGHRRAGVPFEQDRYFPKGFDDAISLADYLAITADWDATNGRRLELIDKKLDGTLTENEKPELANLKRLAGVKRQLIMPLPNTELKEKEEDLKRRGLWRGA